ncbi:MAG: carbohydrate-binding family 9-like protein [Candidatus Latescibacteria bacterium]|nr:carbohydrate-binding family 9-like protein [Candidatus Latescibacterota bacterium]
MSVKPFSSNEIASYTCYRTPEPITIDGRLEEAAWRAAPESPRFVDIVSGGPALHDTRSSLLWDDQYLYVSFRIEEPHVRAELTNRDDIIFMENDIEVFIDGGDTYYEFELNALNTIYEVFFIWQDAYKRDGTFDIPEFDLFSGKAGSFGGNNDRRGAAFWRGTHPRGNRWAFPHWDFPGLVSAVHVDGSINDDSTVDKGWSVEIGFPWAGMKHLANGRSLPPQDGDLWKICLARYEKLELGGKATHVGWAWNRVGDPDNHIPERFTEIHFSNQLVTEIA